MVAQATLTRLVLVRIQAGQPFDAAFGLAHGLRPAKKTSRMAGSEKLREAAANGPEQAKSVEGPVASRHLFAEARGLSPELSRGIPVVYFPRLRSGVIYIDSSTDFEQRLEDHISGQACRTTQLDPPVAILRIEVYATFAEARQREAPLKRWSRAKKEALVAGDAASLRNLSRSHD